MEEANRLSRKASEHESRQEWAEAAKAHRQAAEVFRGITAFDFDPVSVLSLTTLANKHARWAEHCELENERRGTIRSSSAANSDSSTQYASANGLPYAPRARGSEKTTEAETAAETAAAEAASSSSGPGGQKENEEREFENFWRYMQNWLSDPAAFTRPMLRQGQRGAFASGADGAHSAMRSSSPPRGIMESFYLVGPNPDQGASVYASASSAITSKAATPLQALDEVDEIENEQQTNVERAKAAAEDAVNEMPRPETAHKTEGKDGYDLDALKEENRSLRALVRHLNEKIRTLESAAQENNMLKSSILNFREEFHRHANAVTMPRLYDQGSVFRRSQTPSASGTPAASDALAKQLQSQLEAMSLENAKQKAQVTKYRERWEKLKESAKRKRQLQEQLHNRQEE
ncbi:hypothetical protein LPJ56_001786 [Coemansia sp. RSA 2599]|nr:hypothetical protein LPJ56_001786 [Coemansia sp. RSA 2599]